MSVTFPLLSLLRRVLLGGEEWAQVGEGPERVVPEWRAEADQQYRDADA